MGRVVGLLAFPSRAVSYSNRVRALSKRGQGLRVLRATGLHNGITAR